MGFFDSLVSIAAPVAGGIIGGLATGGNPAGIMAGVVGGSAVSGALTASKAGDAAQTQADAVASTANTQNAISSEQWNRYLKTFAPLEDKMVSEASKPITEQPGYIRTMGTIDRGFANQEANLRRTMGGRYPNGSGITTMGQTGLDLNRIKTKAGATSDYTVANNANLLNLANLGRGLPATAQSGLSSSGNMYANLANMYGNQAAGAYSGVGNIAGNLMQAYLISNPGAFNGTSGGSTGNMANLGSNYLSNYKPFTVDPALALN